MTVEDTQNIEQQRCMDEEANRRVEHIFPSNHRTGHDDNVNTNLTV